VEDHVPEKIKLSDLATGTRLVVRSRQDWRFAAISHITDERVTITVCSPGGRTYRLRRSLDSEVMLEGGMTVLLHETTDDWRQNFGRYDHRW
jgi:hypothetical protein